MRFNCTNCNKMYELDPSLIQGNAVMFTCRKCQQQMVIRRPDDSSLSVVPAGKPGERIQSQTQEISRVTKRRLSIITAPHVGRKENPPSWYVTALGRRQGPMTDLDVLDLLVNSRISPGTYAWRKTMPEWVRIKDIPEMAGVLEEAIRRNPELAARMDEKSSLSSARLKTGQSSLQDTLGPTGPTSSGKAQVDEIYPGLGYGPIDPRNASIIQHEDAPDEEDDSGNFGRGPTPTVRDMQPVNWGAEIQDTLRHSTVKTSAYKRRDTTPINLAALKRDRRTTRIVIAVVGGIIAITSIIAVVFLLLNKNERAGTAPAERPPMSDGDAGVIPPQRRGAVQPDLDRREPQNPVDRAGASEPVPRRNSDSTDPARAVNENESPVRGDNDEAPAHALPATTDEDTQKPVPNAIGTTTLVNSRYIGRDGLSAFVASQMAAFGQCRGRLNRRTDASINVNLSFVLTTDGKPVNILARPDGIDEPRLARCVEDVVRSWKFDPRADDLPYSGTISM